MADETPRLKLPFMSTAQVQKELTFNELAAMVDALIQLTIKQTGLTEPPANPAEGDVYLVGDDATGLWLDRDQQIAFYVGGWHYITPQQGWLGYSLADSNYYKFDDGAWAQTLIVPVSKLVELTDVAISAPDASVDAYVLTYDNDSSSFVLQPVAHKFGDLDDADVDEIADGQVLKWDAETSKFVGYTLPAAPETGATTFLGLTDTPDAYTDLAGKVPRVSEAEDGLEFYTPPTPSKLTDLDDTPNALTGFAGYYLRVNAAADGFELKQPKADVLPAAGATGQVLAKSSDDDYAVGWVSPATGGGDVSYPAFADNAGKVLAVNAAEDGVEWITASTGDGGGSTGGGGSVDVIVSDTPTDDVFDFSDLDLSDYSEIEVVMEGLTLSATGLPVITFYVDGTEATTGYHVASRSDAASGSSETAGYENGDSIELLDDTSTNWQLDPSNTGACYSGSLSLFNPTGTAHKNFVFRGGTGAGASDVSVTTRGGGTIRNTGAITGIKVAGSSTISTGRVTVYGKRRVASTGSGGGTGGGGERSTPEVRTSSIQTVEDDSITVTIPAGAVEGDLAVIFVSGGYSPPDSVDGWITVDNTVGTGQQGSVYAKLLTAADLTSGGVTLGFSGSFRIVASIVIIDGDTFGGWRAPVSVYQSSENGITSKQICAYAGGPPALTLVYISDRGATDNTLSEGTQLQTINQSDGSAAVYAVTSDSPIGVVADAMFSDSTSSGYYIAMIPLVGNLIEGGGGGSSAPTSAHGAHFYWRLNVSETSAGLNISIAELGFLDGEGGTNQATDGVASTSGNHGSGESGDQAFDGNAATYWNCDDSSGAGWISYYFGNAVEVGAVSIQARADSPDDAPRDFTVQYSDDGVTWEDAWTVSGQVSWTAGEVREFPDPVPPVTAIGDAPKDGDLYARRDGAWEAFTPGTFVTLTQAEYDALDPPDADTYYFIKEA